MNIVTSLFVEQANQASKRDKDLTTQHEMQEEKIYADHLMAMKSVVIAR